MGIAPAGEPRPIVPPLASFYVRARGLGWLIVRATAGGMLLLFAHWPNGFAAGLTPSTARSAGICK